MTARVLALLASALALPYCARVLPTLPLEVLASVRAQTWLALFERHGYPAGLTRARARPLSSLDVVARLLAEDAMLPLAFARALVTIVAFSSEDARRDVYNAAAALSYPHRWPEATSPADVIAHLLAHDDDPLVAKLLDAAHTLRNRAFRSHSSFVYFGPRRRGAASPTPGAASRLVPLVTEWCTSRDFGRVVSIDERASAGSTAWEIVHEDRAHTVLVAPAVGSTKSPSLVIHRPLRSHRVTYAPARRRLDIVTDCAEAVTPLARLFGVALFGNLRYFLDATAVDLWMLQELGAASLEVPELAHALHVSGIGGTWHSGKGHALTPRGDDLFKALARYKIRIEGGRLDLVTLRALAKSKDGAPPGCDVALRPPHLCTVSEPELAPLLDDFLDRARITDPEPRPRDFFTRQPWIDANADWIADEGEVGFAALVASGILKAKPENRAVWSPEHPHVGPMATAYPLGGTRYLAWSPDPTVAPFVVEKKDLVVYALQFGKLAAAIARELGLDGPAAKLDEDGVLCCGRRALGPTHVHVFLATRPIRATTAERLRDAAGFGHAVLILPEGRKAASGLREIAMPKLAGPWHPLLAEIVRALRLESLVDATLFAPKDARFVLQRASGRVWLDGVACRVTELHFRLVEILLRHDGNEVHTKEIADYIARGRGHEDTTRRQIESLYSAIEKSFKSVERKPPKDLRDLIAMSRLGHYVLRAKGYVV